MHLKNGEEIKNLKKWIGPYKKLKTNKGIFKLNFINQWKAWKDQENESQKF